MPATFTVVGANTTITLTYTAPTATMLNVVDSMAHGIYSRDGVPIIDTRPAYSTLTNQQKLDLVYVYIREMIIRDAKTYAIRIANMTAEVAARADAEVKFNFV